MQPLISVIVPVYKVETYLRKCVDSILNQTYGNLEVILVDDGSPDGCPAICEEYAGKDPRVQVIHQKNGGLSHARNTGMAQARGEYLMFVDSDDLLPADSAERLLKLALAEKAELVIGGHSRFETEPARESREKEVYQVMTPEQAMADALENGCASWARLYRRELHTPVLFPVGRINEDEAIVLALLERCSRVVKTNAEVYHYRCRPESITTSTFSPKKMAWPAHCRENLAYIQKHHPHLEPLAAARYRSSLLWALTEIALSGQSFRQEVRQLRRELRENRKLFRETTFAVPQNRIRMTMLMYLPFGVYRRMLRLKRGA